MSASASQIQRTDDGALRHLLTLEGLDKADLTAILDLAERYLAPPEQQVVRSPVLNGLTVANLFFEPSTRTRASFELAARRLGADVLNLDVSTSSRIKGESILDTIYTLQAMQVDSFVVRDAAEGVPAMIAAAVRDGVSVLNAGEATVAHPTQGLLDLLTVRRARPDLSALNICIVGDIAHSRVARSAVQAFSTMEVASIRLVSPPSLQPDPALYPAATAYTEVTPAIAGADIIMALRIQRERIADQDDIPDVAAYASRYGLNSQNMKGAADGALIMHPGPMNRGVEIADDVADSPQSLITEQVRNGVAIRMALLQTVNATNARWRA